MDIKTDGAALSLIFDLFDTKTSTKPRIPETVQKKPYVFSEINQPFPRSTPEEQGVESARIAQFITSVKRDGTLDPHGILILRNGCVIAEARFGAYDQRVWHITYSECKSVVGLAIGMLIDEGKLSLSDRLVDVMAKHTNLISRRTHKAITLRHLLTMTTGVAFNEAGTVTETDWVKCYMESAILAAPGEKFAYNSMNTYMLSAIAKEITDQGLSEYLTPRLFAPLGIENFYWEKCPKGIEKGGMGLYILPEDMAKIGQLVLNGGLWKGERLVSEEWISESTRAQIVTPDDLGDYNYGYQIWVGRTERSFLFNGMFSQNVLGYLDSGLLIVSNAGNNELFQQSNFYKYTATYFGNAVFSAQPLPEDKRGRRALAEACAEAADCLSERRNLFSQGLFDRRKAKSDLELSQWVSGKRYLSWDAAAAPVGLFPLFAQALQNNYTKGLSSLSFECREGQLYLIVSELDEDHALPVGLDGPAYATVNIHGETYDVGVTGKFTTDEDDTLTLKIRVSFLEMPNSRFLKIFFYDDYIRVKWSESPGLPYLTGALDAFKEKSALVEMLVIKADEEVVRYRIQRMVEPELKLILDPEQE